MKTRYVITLSALLASLTGVAEAAAPEDLMKCRNVSGFDTSCVLTLKELAKPMSFEGESYESEYHVNFDYTCKGHDLNLALRTGKKTASSSDPVFALDNQKAANQTIVVSGPGSLWSHDTEPTTTRRLTFTGDCKLAIKKVDVFPSANTQSSWTLEAKAQAKAIKLASRLYQLSRDYDLMEEWPYSKLDLLSEKVNLLLEFDPENPHYIMMRETIDAAVEGKPSPYTAEEMEVAAADLTSTLRSELDAEIAEGERQIRRFDKWKLAAEATLKDALASVSE